MNQERDQGIRPKSVERQMIEQHLLGAEVGQLVTYEEIEKLIGEACGPDSRLRGLFQTSIREMVRHGMAFECRNGEGYIRLDTPGIGAHMMMRTGRVKRLADRTVRIGTVADLSEADTAQKSTILGLMTINRLVARTVSTKNVKRFSVAMDPTEQVDILKRLADKVMKRKCEA